SWVARLPPFSSPFSSIGGRVPSRVRQVRNLLIRGRSHLIKAYSEFTVRLETLTIAKDGARLFSAALSFSELRDLEGTLADQPPDHAGVRLHGIPRLRPFLVLSGPVGRIAASALGPNVFRFEQYSLTKAPRRTGFSGGIRTARLPFSNASR